MIKNLKKKKGFTLIELIIVIAILGILAAIAIPKFGNAQENARRKADIATAKTIADTAAMLIANEEIDPVTDAEEYVVLKDDSDPNAGGKIANTLQTVPAIQSASGVVFCVKIEASGNVIVYGAANASTDSSNTNQIYPKPDVEADDIAEGSENPYYNIVGTGE